MTGLDSLPRLERKVRLAPWRWPALEARLRRFICRRCDEAAQAIRISTARRPTLATHGRTKVFRVGDAFHNATDVAGARRTPSDELRKVGAVRWVYFGS